MPYKINSQEINSVLNLSNLERFKHFVKRSCDWEEIWALRNESGWVFMRQVLADFSVSISELKKSPSALLAQASGSPIAVLNHNKPAAYLIPAETYEALMGSTGGHSE